MSDKEKKELEVSRKKQIDQSAGEPTRQGVYFVPDVDILESDEAITLYADLPGVKPENLDVDVREGVLTLTATIEPPAEKQKLIHREYDLGGYQRSFTLGERIDVERINASFKNGVLTLTLPKQERHKPRKIKISS